MPVETDTSLIQKIVKSLPPISFGCMSLKGSHAENAFLLHQAMDLGISLFDTADLYDQGENELSVGRAFKGRRDQILIATKVGNQWRPDGSGWDWNPRKEYILQAVDDSLRRLQTDYIDLYQLHGGTIEDPIDEAIEAFELLKQQGKIREYGISSIRPNVIREWLKQSALYSVMMQYSLLDRRPEESCLSLLKDHGVKVIVRGALAKGMLVDKAPKPYLGHDVDAVLRAQDAVQALSSPQRTPAQTALHYCLAHPAVSTIAAGARTLDQLQHNAGTVHAPSLSPSEIRDLQHSTTAFTYQAHR